MRLQSFLFGVHLLLILISIGCSTPPKEEPQSPSAVGTVGSVYMLPLADYPPAGTPYYIERGDFWLVHIPGGELNSFVPVSPDYEDRISVDECRFVWSEAVNRFVDPCSGDEWELDGRLIQAHSTERWSKRDLDQYVVKVEGGTIFIRQ